MNMKTLLNEVITLNEGNLRSPYGCLEMQENLGRINKHGKIPDMVTMHIVVKSKIPMTAFELAGQFRDYADWLVCAEEQIVAITIESSHHDKNDEITIIINKA